MYMTEADKSERIQYIQQFFIFIFLILFCLFSLGDFVIDLIGTAPERKTPQNICCANKIEFGGIVDGIRCP